MLVLVWLILSPFTSAYDADDEDGESLIGRLLYSIFGAFFPNTNKVPSDAMPVQTCQILCVTKYESSNVIMYWHAMATMTDPAIQVNMTA